MKETIDEKVDEKILEALIVLHNFKKNNSKSVGYDQFTDKELKNAMDRLVEAGYVDKKRPVAYSINHLGESFLTNIIGFAEAIF